MHESLNMAWSLRARQWLAVGVPREAARVLSIDPAIGEKRPATGVIGRRDARSISRVSRWHNNVFGHLPVAMSP